MIPRKSLVMALLLSLAACAAPPPLVNGALNPRDWFLDDYAASRARFRDDCQHLAVEPGDSRGMLHVRSKIDPDLTVDHCIFARGGDRLLVIQSGIHGSEAAAGTAVQAMMMRRHLPDLLMRGIDVVFLHALDPYGYKYNRRTDEYNVNLNRNFPAQASLYQTPNDEYRRDRALFEPTGQVRSVIQSTLQDDLAIFSHLAGAGFKAQPLIEGFDNGQYQFPRGVNYGGDRPAQQVVYLRTTLGPLMKRSYKKILFLDFHTALGPNGQLSVILPRKPAPWPEQDLRAMLAGLDASGIKIKPAGTGFFTFGDVIDYVPALAADRGRALAVTMEYGTMGDGVIDGLNSVTRMITENQAHFFGCVSGEVCAQVARDFQEMFNPVAEQWRRAVLTKADAVFHVLRDRF